MPPIVALVLSGGQLPDTGGDGATAGVAGGTELVGAAVPGELEAADGAVELDVPPPEEADESDPVEDDEETARGWLLSPLEQPATANAATAAKAAMRAEDIARGRFRLVITQGSVAERAISGRRAR